MRTTASVGCRDVRGERGAALISVFLLLMIMSALCTALAVSGTTETLIARNHQVAAQSRAAAEAGLVHGLQVTIENLQNWQLNGFTNGSAAMTRLLRGPDDAVGTTATDLDNGSLEAFGIARPPGRVQLAGLPGIFYEVRLFDEDDPARGVTLSATDITRVGENGTVASDGNTRVVVRAIGYASGSAVATLEAMIVPLTLPAILTNQSLTISGNPQVLGTEGDVHSNQNLALTGNPSIAGDATASDTYSTTGTPVVGGVSGSGFGNIAVPPVRAIDHLSKADFILKSNGTLTNPAGTVLCDASSNQNACATAGYGWRFNGAAGWSIQGSGFAPGTFYVQGNASISGSPGSLASPAAISIIAEGWIDISGNPTFMPASPELLYVTDMDLRIGGNVLVPFAMEGLILVREQISIQGNPTLSGQILVEGAASVSSLVTANTISGNPTISYNGIGGLVGFTVSAWRTVP